MKKTIIYSIAIIILLSSAIYAYFVFTVHPVIQNTIYRSAQLSGNNLQKNINKYQFKSIINLRGKDIKESWYQTENDIAKNNNIKLYNVRLSAYKFPVCSEVDSLVKILQTAKKPILLHCQAGADRSGMASALALSIEQDASLQDIKTHFSWKYFVNPFRDQTSGKLFFSSYEQFLLKSGINHNRSNLLFWIKNNYIDYKGNIEFVIEYANKERFNSSRKEDRRLAVIQKKGFDNISLNGWAFDYRNKMPIKYLRVSIDNTTHSLAEFTFNRPDVARYYNLEKHEFDDYKFGWKTEINIKRLNKGCYKVLLQVGDDSKSARLIKDTGYDLCIK
jgi:protein tyrosine phosphatase (PTP) superfamily phosphohydrolase (DUF442 family)